MKYEYQKDEHLVQSNTKKKARVTGGMLADLISKANKPHAGRGEIERNGASPPC
jgi:hypothetical protein